MQFIFNYRAPENGCLPASQESVAVDPNVDLSSTFSEEIETPSAFIQTSFTCTCVMVHAMFDNFIRVC